MDFRELLFDLSRPDAFPEPGPDVRVVQTHVSAVFLTGARAYKVKKPLRLWGFLDYGDVEARRRACEAEVALNRRLAPDVYLGVERVVRRDGRLFLGGEGATVDHAVVMRRFDETTTLDARLRDGRASRADVESLAARIRRFHDVEGVRGAEITRAGRPVVFARIVRQNVRSTAGESHETFPERVHRSLVAHLARHLCRVRAILARRARQGRIVEAHGDLRAEHALRRADGGWDVVDGVEFSEALRCLDPLSDAAFLAMDLAAHGRRDLERAFLEAYLGGPPDADADAAALLPLYLAYRAHVRAKVEALRAREEEIPRAERATALDAARRHFALAWGYARRGSPPPLVALVGPTGVGKSAVARAFADAVDATIVRSDVVRKSLAEFDADARYSDAATRSTYAAMLAQGETAVRADRPVVLDATFLRRLDRDAARALARRLRLPFALLSVEAPLEVARARIAARARVGTDPSDGTYEVHLAQVRSAEPFSTTEAPLVVVHDATLPPSAAVLPLLERWLRETRQF